MSGHEHEDDGAPHGSRRGYWTGFLLSAERASGGRERLPTFWGGEERDQEELEARRTKLVAEGGFQYPASQTPWQEIQRSVVGQMNTGAILEGAEKYQRIAQTMGLPRDNH